MSAKNHVHKYVLRDIGKKDKPRRVYACARPDCSHFMPSLQLIIGKESICWECNEKMIMSKDILRKLRVKPRCYKCREKQALPPEVIQEVDKLDDAIAMIAAMRGVVK